MKDRFGRLLYVPASTASPTSPPSSTTTRSSRRGRLREIQDLEPLADKWRAFGFAVEEVDGHDVAALRSLFRRLPFASDRPSTIICHTVKGKGLPFAEHDPNWHHKAKIPAELVSQMCAALE